MLHVGPVYIKPIYVFYDLLFTISPNSYNTDRTTQKYHNINIKACNFTKSDTPPRVFFLFFKLCKWY